MLGRLFGLTPAAAETARIVEVGCGDGGNVLAIAQTLPRARVTGIDAAAGPLEQGQRLARAASLENVQLHVGDLLDLQHEDVGPVDYLIAHGVYSWIPPRVRGALLECCRRWLAPHGIAFISYNAYPGSYLRDMARDMLAFHLEGVTEPADRLARAHQLMEAIVSLDTRDPYGRVLRDHLERMLAAGDVLLYHDDLAVISTPFYFHEFIEHAAAHELQFLSEAELSSSRISEVPQGVAAVMSELPADAVVREQYLDFFGNRMFRQTLLARASAPVTRSIDPDRLAGMAAAAPVRRDGDGFVTPDGARLQTDHPLIAAALARLGERWPGSVPVADLAEAPGSALGSAGADAAAGARAELHRALLEAYIAGLVVLLGSDRRVVPQAGEYPCASPLARAQVAAGAAVVSTLEPGNLPISDTDGQLLSLLDGTRDRTALATGVGAHALDEMLDRFAASGLIMR